jgi:predicted nucleic acid-binding protein
LKVFIDSNIPMYVAGAPHPNREFAIRFLERVRAGSVEACTSTEVLQEILYRYTALGRREDAVRVYDLFVQLCPVVFAVTLADTDRARDLLASARRVSARDALHAAVMHNHRVDVIATFDRDFDEISGIRRFPLTGPV